METAIITRSVKRKVLLLVAVPILLLASVPFPAFSVECQIVDPSYWPTDNWLVTTPEEQGMSSVILQALTNHIASYNLPVESIIVVRHGFIVFEIYPGTDTQNTLQLLHSVSKSFTSALIGIAVEQGFIPSVNTPVVSLFPTRTIANLDDRKEAMTVEHVLNMQAGVEWDEWTYPYEDPQNDLLQMMLSSDPTQFFLDLPMAADPGTVWVYNTGSTHLLGAIIRETTGQTPFAFANEYLFGPLGITTAFWFTDRTGLSLGGSGLNLCPRDMAKFGFLFLHDGYWDGVQVVPEAWATESQAVAVVPWQGTGYGYQWWKDLGLGTFEARGRYNQWIVVSQEHDIVVVMTADDTTGIINTLSLVNDYVFAAVTNQYPAPQSPLVVGLAIVLVIGVPVTVAIGLILWKRRLRQT
ncbi:MAG: serine hydrolase domain-containing protein [Candidatus Hodarchaeota archaeon]